MNTAQLIQFLQKNNLRFFTIHDIIPLYNGSRSAASSALKQLTNNGLLTKIKRGLWVNNTAADFRIEELVSSVSSPWPAYVSLYSALAEYGYIAEIPQVVYGVTSHKAARITTPIGSIFLYHIPHNAFWGYSVKRINKSYIPIADPEKAFLDTFYLSWTKRSPVSMPTFREKPLFDLKKIKSYAKKWNHPVITDYVKTLIKKGKA